MSLGVLLGFGKSDVGVTFVILAAVILGLVGLAHLIRGRF
jgi:hypothetical protein